MTLEESEMTESDVMAVRENTLQENYTVHDFAEEYLVQRLEQAGFDVRDHGDYAPDADKVYFGDGPDLELRRDGETVAYIEIKTKRSSNGPEWFGRLNRRMWNEYVEFAAQSDVPVFLWFGLVDEADDRIDRRAFVEVQDRTQLDGDVTDIAEVSLVFDQENLQSVTGSDSLMAVDAGDVQTLDSGGQLVDGIPSVHGNDVVCVDDDEFRSFQWFLFRVGPTVDD